jgi:ferredoxin
MAFADALAADSPGQVDLVPQDERGLIDLETLLGTPEAGTLVYCCGPGPLLDAVSAGMEKWPSGSLHLERFAAEPAPAQTAGQTSFEVELSLSGKTLTVTPEDSILETVERAGVTVLSSCHEGICGSCETGVLDGVPDHRDQLLTEDERAANDCMVICVSRSVSARLVLEL